MSPQAPASTTQAPNRAPNPNQTGGPTNFGEQLCHLVEDHDPDRALCGKDVTDFPWNPPWPFCVVCVDLAQHGETPGDWDQLPLL